MTARRWLVISVVLLGLIAAAVLATGVVRIPHVAAMLEIRQNRELWQRKAIKDYQFVFQLGCFCLSEYLIPTRITVRDGQIVEAVNAETGEPISGPRRAELSTLDGLFDAAYDYAQTADAIDLGFDANYGFINSLSVDHIKQAVDDEFGYSVKEFAAYMIPNPQP